MPERAQCRSWDELEVHLTTMYARQDALADRVRHTEKQLDTLGSPWWKRIWWRIDGFKPWYVVEPRRRWRPWHQGAA